MVCYHFSWFWGKCQMPKDCREGNNESKYAWYKM
jgi:hypothetical protein